MTKHVRGSQLKVGDTIEVWWSIPPHTPNQDTITKLVPYKGPLAHLWKKGARLADFSRSKVGMTIDNNEDYKVIT